MTNRQQEIVAVARKIIGSEGMELLTVREIAKRLRITDGALYRHFKSKNEILSLLIDDIERTLIESIDTAADKESGSLAKLEAVLFSHISYAEQRKGLTFIVISETLGLQDSLLRKKMFGVVEAYLRRIQHILDVGIKNKDFRQGLNVHLASLAFFGLVQSAVTFWALSGYRSSMGRQKIIKLFDVYKKGIVDL